MKKETIILAMVLLFITNVGANNLITKKGNLGIGTATPEAQLVVGNDFGATVSGSSGGIGVFGSNLAVKDAHNLYTPYSHPSYGYAGIGALWGSLRFFAGEGPSQAGQLVSAQPKMTIKPNGRIGIGTTDPQGELHITGWELLKLQSGGWSGPYWTIMHNATSTSGDYGLLFKRGENPIVSMGSQTSGDALSVYGRASATDFVETSDARLKEIKGNYEKGLKEINQINPIYYKFKKNNNLNLPINENRVGISAQELQKIIPEAVSSGNEGYLTINNTPILWALVNAVKEQQKQIEELQKELENIRAKT